jgi:predicted methyltransferase
MIVLSYLQASTLLNARQSGVESVDVSLDLNLTKERVGSTPTWPTRNGKPILPWDAIETIAADKEHCYWVENGAATVIRGYSEMTGRYYSLYPTESAPTMVVAGFPMHRIKDTDPHRDTLAKIKAIAPVGGAVLDTCTGLGYTAIEAARTAASVTTIELDPVAQDICRQNSWSQGLFNSPNITQRIGDCFDVIEEMDDATFSVIIHDPPTLSLAGDLYSGEFYRQCHRVLKRNGRLFHYIGDPNSSSGARTTKGVVRRLQEAGFSRVKPAPAAFGVVAGK